MIQNGERLSRLYADTFVAACMSIYPSATENFVCFHVLIVKSISATEPVDERRQSAFAVCMGEKVECLETLDRTLLGATIFGRGGSRSIVTTYNRLCEIGSVGMWLETFTSISSVLRGQVRCEIVESAFQVSVLIYIPSPGEFRAHIP